MSYSNKLMYSAITALMFGAVLMIEDDGLGTGFFVGLLLFLYFLAYVVLKITWGVAGKITEAINGK